MFAERTAIGLKGGVPAENPVASASPEREKHTRNRVLSREEVDQLIAAAPTHLGPNLLPAYHTAVRKSEVLNLTWDRVDFKAGVIRLRPEHTETREGGTIPLAKELSETLKNATISLEASAKPVP